MNFKFNLVKEKIEKITKKISDFWFLKNIWIFLAIWIFLSISMFMFWFTYIFQYEWSDEKKDIYVREKGQGVVLNEKKQNLILENMEERINFIEAKNNKKVKDIFGIK